MRIRVIIAIELIDVEDLLIVTHFKARETVGYNVVFTFDTFKFREKFFEYQAPVYYVFYIKKIYKLDVYDQYRPLSGALI